MFDTGVTVARSPLEGAVWDGLLAAEPRVEYMVAAPTADAPVRPAADAPPEGAAAPEAAVGPVTAAELVARGVAVEGLAEALAVVDRGLDALAGVGLDGEADEALAAGLVAVARLRDRVDGARVEVLERFDARGVHRADGAVTAAGWYRTRTRTLRAEAGALTRTARRLTQLPLLRAALVEGSVSLRHADLVCKAAVPRRMAAFQESERILVDLARQADPGELAVAVQLIVDGLGSRPDPTLDPGAGAGDDAGGCDPQAGADCEDEGGVEAGDGGAAGPERGAGLPQGPGDERRELGLHPTIDGLWTLVGTLDPVVGETLLALLEALSTPDPEGVGVQEARTAGQVRHDALAELVRRASGLAGLPRVHGRAPHVGVFVDVVLLAAFLKLLPGGEEEQQRLLAGRQGRPVARLRSGLRLSPAYALRLLAAGTLTLVQVAGPWRPVGVGRRMRTLPAYLRDVLDLLHTRCRGPDCDRFITWTDAHHVLGWTEGGETDLNNSIPVCRAHHTMVTSERWTASLNTDTGVVTWTSPQGRVLHDHP